MGSIPQFYVYVLARPNGKPFYVGKGQGRRIFKHEREAKSGCACHKCRVIRKIWRSGGEVQRYTVFTSDDEQAVLDYEQELIALYGKHTLTNVTDGGTGVPGWIPTKQTRAKIGASLKGRKPTPEANANVSAALKGHFVSEETKAKIRAKAQARAQTPEGRAHLLAASEKARAPEAIERSKETHRVTCATPEWKERQSAAITAYHASDEGKAKHSAGQKRRYSRPEEREILRQNSLERERRKRESDKV